MNLKKIHKAIDEDFEDHLEHIGEYIKVDNRITNMENIFTLTRMLKLEIENLGGRASILDYGELPIIYGEINANSDKTILIYKNYDIIPPLGPRWRMNPFGAQVIDTEKHREWTGVKNALILDNLSRLASMGRDIIVRVPLIPGVNDDDWEFGRIAEFVHSLSGVDVLHIMPFHHIGQSKYEMLNLPYPACNFEEKNEEALKKCKSIAEEYELMVDIGGSNCFTTV